jgi:ATP-dependent helicase/nuclease subunit B
LSEPSEIQKGSNRERSPTGHPFVAQLADLCRRWCTRTKWVLVPTHAMGHTLGERLARLETGWVNLRFVTPLDVAIRMAGPFLVEKGIDPSEDTLGPPLVMKLLLETSGSSGARHTATGGYFRPMAEHTTLAAALWRTLRELRFAGMGGAHLPRGAFESAEKHAELRALVEGYERYLQTNQLADVPAVFAEAPRHLDFCPILPTDLSIEAPDVTWPPLVRRFLDVLPGERVVPQSIATPGVAVGTRPSDSSAVDPVAPAATSDSSRMRFLRAPGDAPPPTGDGTLDLFHAGGRDAEIDEVCRRILASGRPLDDVEVVCATDAYPSLVWEKAVRLGWPVTVATGVPAAMTRPGRALLAWCDWIESDFAAADLRRLLQSGDCAPRAFRVGTSAMEGALPDLSSGRAARLLIRADVAWGREAYRLGFGRLIASLQRKARDAEIDEQERQWSRLHLEHALRLQAWVGGMLEAVPSTGPEADVSLVVIARAANDFLHRSASRASALDAAAFVALSDALDELSALGGHTCPIRIALQFVRERIDMVRAGRDRPRPGALHVSMLREPGLSGRKLTFVVGLEEGCVFPAAMEDPVMLDSERRIIAGSFAVSNGSTPGVLPTSADRQDQALLSVVARLAELGSESAVVLSFSCRDTREFRETFPSWIVLQVFRLIAGKSDATYRDLKTWLGEPISCVPHDCDGATTASGWWLALRDASEAPAAIAKAWPSLARGRLAQAARDSDRFTEFDGFVPAAGPILDPSRNPITVSATRLEQAAGCPFTFFLRHGLGIEPLEEAERDRDAWLDPLTRGGELHALYAAVMRAARDEGRPVSMVKDRVQARERAARRLEALAREMPPPSDEVFTREREDFLEDVERFVELEVELAAGGVEPVAFEVSFGMSGFPDFTEGVEEDREPLERPDPVTVVLDGERRLVLRGRIDRIDRTSSGYEVVDYKTGRFWAADYQGTFNGGRRLQHALYGLAAAELLKPIDCSPRIAAGVYRFPTARGRAAQKRIATPQKQRILAVLTDLLDVIGEGAFVHADAAEVCRFCNFSAACGRSPFDRAAAKLGNREARALDAWRRLTSQE